MIWESSWQLMMVFMYAYILSIPLFSKNIHITHLLLFFFSGIGLWHTHSGVVVFHCLIRVQKGIRLIPYYCGSILGPSYSRDLTLSPLDPTPQTPPPVPASHISGSSPLLSHLLPKLPNLPPFQYHALVLSPSLAAPLSPIGARDACPINVSKPSPTACLQQAPENAWMAAPDSI